MVLWLGILFTLGLRACKTKLSEQQGQEIIDKTPTGAVRPSFGRMSRNESWAYMNISVTPVTMMMFLLVILLQ